MQQNFKDDIIDNAITLFSEHGYEGTTLNEIAKSVNIKKASLYYHFSGKDDIYRSTVEICTKYFIDFIKDAHSEYDYSMESLHQFLYNFIFNVDERFIRLYVQLPYAPRLFNNEFYDNIKSVHEILDNEILNYYNETTFTIDKTDFQNMVLLFVESWYLKCCFAQRYGKIDDSKIKFKNEVFSLLNVISEK
ncbi:TetR family transcriptional regulator [Staphylococcus aureus]